MSESPSLHDFPPEAMEERFRLLLAARQGRLREELLRETILAFGNARRREQLLSDEMWDQNLRLEALNTQKDELLGMAAHDLRNPLTVVLGFADVLLAAPEIRESEQLLEFTSLIRETASGMVELIDDILDVSEIESGQLRLRLEDTDLAKVVKRVCTPNQMLAQRKSIDLQVELPDEPLIAHVDAKRLRQVVTNLLSNAIKFSHSGTDITVRLAAEGNNVLLSIADQGQGIPEKDMPKLFRPFVQMSPQATAGEKSTGLGLSIVKKIVDLHKGTITVESEVGVGTTFTVRLPGLR